MTDPDIIEVAARALAQTYDGINEWEGYQERTRENCRMMARSVLAAVTPLIRSAALEEAAKALPFGVSHALIALGRAQALEEAGQAAMDCDVSQHDAYMARRDIAVAIRAIKEQP